MDGDDVFDGDWVRLEDYQRLEAENTRQREALEFYADEENWEEPVWTGTRGGPKPAPAHEDAGEIARAALPDDEPGTEEKKNA